MSPLLLSLALLMQRSTTCAPDLAVRCKGHWQAFCERHIITDDPRTPEEQQKDDDDEREERRRK